MKDELFFLEMKDHWTTEDWNTYNELTTKQIPVYKEEHKIYKIGDTKTENGEAWRVVEIDDNGAILWELME